MLGAILGDMVGSPYEFDRNNHKSKDFPLLSEKSHFTDDTVMTVAVARGLMAGQGNAQKTFAEVQHEMRRWGKADAESALGVPVKGVSITKTETGFTYATKIVGTRTFQEKMMLYPIPQSEILRSAGKIEQNPGW